MCGHYNVSVHVGPEVDLHHVPRLQRRVLTEGGMEGNVRNVRERAMGRERRRVIGEIER